MQSRKSSGTATFIRKLIFNIGLIVILATCINMLWDWSKKDDVNIVFAALPLGSLSILILASVYAISKAWDLYDRETAKVESNSDTKSNTYQNESKENKHNLVPSKVLDSFVLNDEHKETYEKVGGLHCIFNKNNGYWYWDHEHVIRVETSGEYFEVYWPRTEYSPGIYFNYDHVRVEGINKHSSYDLVSTFKEYLNDSSITRGFLNIDYITQKLEEFLQDTIPEPQIPREMYIYINRVISVPWKGKNQIIKEGGYRTKSVMWEQDGYVSEIELSGFDIWYLSQTDFLKYQEQGILEIEKIEKLV